MLNLRW